LARRRRLRVGEEEEAESSRQKVPTVKQPSLD
jgi:hypothetical protein